MSGNKEPHRAMYFSDKQYIAPPPPPDCQVFLMFFTYFSKTRPEKEGKRYLNVYEISPQQGSLAASAGDGRRAENTQPAVSYALIISPFAGVVKSF